MRVDLLRAAGQCVAGMAVLRFFPSDKEAREKLIAMVAKMASSVEQIEWLGDVMTSEYNEWPGPQDLRGVFCTRYKPADGRDTFLTGGPVFERIQSQATEQHERNKLPSGARSAPLQLTDGRITKQDIKGVMSGR